MLKRYLLWMIQALILLYAVFVVGLLVLRLLPFEYRVVHVLFVFLLYVFVPLVILLPIAVLWRSVVVRLAVGLVCAVFLFLFGLRFIPPQRPDTIANLRVFTFNQLYANKDFDSFATLVRELDPDVVAIQELSERFEERSMSELLDLYPYQSLFASEYRLGVLSKYPLEDVSFVDGRFAQRMVVVVGERRVSVFNVHLDSPYLMHKCEDGKCRYLFDTAKRGRQYPVLVDLLQAVDGPVLAMGDFNTSDAEPWYDRFGQQFVDVFARTNWGFGFTFPGDASSRWGWLPFPLIRLDYVWSSSDVLAIDSWIDCSMNRSDHCAVIADVRIP